MQLKRIEAGKTVTFDTPLRVYLWVSTLADVVITGTFIWYLRKQAKGFSRQCACSLSGPASYLADDGGRRTDGVIGGLIKVAFQSMGVVTSWMLVTAILASESAS